MSKRSRLTEGRCPAADKIILDATDDDGTILVHGETGGSPDINSGGVSSSSNEGF